MNHEEKRMYLAPVIEVMKVEHEGVMALSGNAGVDMPRGNGVFANQTQYHDAMVGNDLGELINDILTFEE